MTDRPRDREERDGERFLVLGELSGAVMVFQPIVVLEISHGGAQVETGFPLQLNSLHDFRLVLGSQTIVVKGRIAHSRTSGLDPQPPAYRSGIQFIELSDRVSDAVADMITALKAGYHIVGSVR